MIDTSNYMIAGYGIFFGVAIIYITSLVSRWKKLKRDLSMLENLDN